MRGRRPSMCEGLVSVAFDVLLLGSYPRLRSCGMPTYASRPRRRVCARVQYAEVVAHSTEQEPLDVCLHPHTALAAPPSGFGWSRGVGCMSVRCDHNQAPGSGNGCA